METKTMGEKPSSPELEVVRLPGEAGPILRCAGELTAQTVPALRSELDTLLPLEHPGIVLNLTDCGFLDVDGILAVLLAYKELRERDRRLAVVAGTGSVARLLRVLGIDWVLPVCPSEEVAARALRGGGPAPAPPASWAAARERTLARWREILASIDQAKPTEIERDLTSMTALCDRAEAIFESRPGDTDVRCRFCPLFHALGARPEDIGCRSVLDPIREAVRRGDTDSARKQVTALIDTLEQMPVEP
jgi:anti-sigma B factor antagonist